MEIKIICRGCTMRGRERTWHSYLSSSEQEKTDNSYIIFKPDKKNQYDPNAIEVLSKGEIFGQLGYVGREYTQEVKEMLSKKIPYTVKMTDEKKIVDREIELIVLF